MGSCRTVLANSIRRSRGGRPRVSDRACLTGIIFVLRSGIPWQMLPQELGCGSGMTCWRRLRDWQLAGDDLLAVAAQNVDAEDGLQTREAPHSGLENSAALVGN